MNENHPVVTLLSVLLLISVFVAGFFAYRTQNLVKEITKLKSVPDPIAQASPTPDPTVDWKTYIDDEYSFKYPNDLSEGPATQAFKTFGNSNNSSSLIVGEVENRISVTNNDKFKNVSEYITVGYDNIISRSTLMLENKMVEKIKLKDEMLIVFLSADQKYFDYISFKSNSDTDNDTNQKLFEQILSTFKFTETAASSSPVTCTMDTKLCNDGSYVGRSGPNCEFATCPTTSPRP